MVTPTSTALPGTPSGAPTPPGAPKPVASGPAPTPPPGLPASRPAIPAVARHGGLAGGRPRLDGLVPGSPEALEADRRKSTARQQEYRDKKRRENPPSLPPSLPATGAGAPSQGQAQAGTQGGDPASALAEILAWVPEDFQEIVSELIGTIEQARVAKKNGLALESKLPPKMVKMIDDDARWDEATKKTLAIMLPKLIAKYANMTGISAEWKLECICGVCLIRLWRKDTGTDALLKQLIEQNKQLLEKPPAKP